MANFEGALDELRISRVARPAALLLADATAQGADSRLISYGADEQSAGQSHFGFILKAMPFDAWVVVAILGLMMLLSWAIMIAKSRHFGRTSKANAVFTESFGKLSGVPLRTLSEMDRQGKAPTAMHDGSLWRIYQVAIDEMQQRHQRDGNSGYLSGATIAAIRASMDAVMVREQEAMARRMNWLSTTIEGAPYVGLFGTVIGIMLVFVVAAMAGAVDINSVAPGMAAALLCTAAGPVRLQLPGRACRSDRRGHGGVHRRVRRAPGRRAGRARPGRGPGLRGAPWARRRSSASRSARRAST